MAAWEIQVTLDNDSNDVGTITATWTETAGVFIYSSRAKKDAGGANAFVAAAIAARDFWQSKRSANDAAATALKTKIMTTDPKAV